MKPLTDRQISYVEYLESAAWRIKRQEAIARDGFRCRICNSDKSVVVHHRKYPKILGTEPVEDLTTLCNKCHNLYHEKGKHKKELTDFEIKRKALRKKRKAAKKALKKQAATFTREYFKRISAY